MKRARRALALLAVAVFVTAFAVAPAQAAPGSTTRVTPTQPNGDTPATTVPDTTSPAIALNGLSTTFSSDATNLVPGDTNGVADVFLRDRAGAIKRVSVTAKGAQANGPSYSPSPSVDGRYIAFVSKATNLVTGDTNGVADIFRKDMRTGAVVRVSVSSAERQAGAASSHPYVSLFGRWVTFDSEAANLAGGDQNGISDAFIRDLQTGKTTRIAPPVFEQIEPDLDLKTYTTHATISYDGTYVAYTRGATGYTPASPAALDAYVLQRATGKQAPIPVPPYASSLPGGAVFTCRPMSDHAMISADGRYVAVEGWTACERNHALVKNDFDPMDVFIYDRLYPRNVTPASVNTYGRPGNGDSFRPSITATGQAISYVSKATNLVSGDTNGVTDVFVRDRGERTTSRVSVPSSGAGQPDGESLSASISYEGRHIAFASKAGNLVSGDTNAILDSFVRDRRIDTRNRAPNLRAPLNGKRTVDAGDKIVLQLRATDSDRDALRYGIILNAPTGASVDPATGRFEWTPTPADAPTPADPEKTFDIVFWVDDPRGAGDVELAQFEVRTAAQTAQCRALGRCEA